MTKNINKILNKILEKYFADTNKNNFRNKIVARSIA